MSIHDSSPRLYLPLPCALIHSLRANRVPLLELTRTGGSWLKRLLAFVMRKISLKFLSETPSFQHGLARAELAKQKSRGQRVQRRIEMSAPAHAAFFGLVETPEGQGVRAYEDWHADDHQPENWALPGVVYANRWVADDAHRAARFVGDERLARAQFLITYFFLDPLDEALAGWNGLAQTLRAQGRMFEERELHLGSIFACTGGEVSGEVPHSAAALPYRRHRGVFLRLGESTEVTKEDEARFTEVLGRDGVNGGLRFCHREGPAYGASRAGFAELYFSAKEPLEVFHGIDPGDHAIFAGSFSTGGDLPG